ncbi:hypothetical protein ScPMuIL_015559 [Solemya velum]
MANAKIVVSLTAGASLINIKPIFSHDSKYLFVCSRSVIKVFSTSGGNCVHELRGHKKLVTGIVVSSRNKLQLLSCSLDCSLIVWDYTDGVLLKRFEVGQPLYGLYRLDWRSDSYIGLTKPQKPDGSRSYNIVNVTLPSGQTKRVKIRVLKSDACTGTKCVAVGSKGSYVAFVNNRKLIIFSTKDEKTTEHELDSESKFTCVTCHPTSPCVATGSSNGKIHFWRNIWSTDSVKTSHHWHSLGVGDLAFTTEGSYLLSGGSECVLVKHHCMSQMNNFLPRLGAPITHVVCADDNMMYATCHSDNVIHIISNAFKLLHIYGGLTVANWTADQGQKIPVGLMCDPRTKAVVLNGKPGHLQFFSVQTDRQLFNLDIVCQNYISPENLERPTVVTEIERAAFDENGVWLATVEVWDDQDFTPEIRLKFWQFTDESQTYVLNTTVELTNQDRVHSLKFRPCCGGGNSLDPMVVTTSSDGKFRLWTLVDDTDIYRENDKWTCQSVGFFRDLPAGAAAFSEDGSLLAVVFDYAVTLWDPGSNVFQQSLLAHTTQHVRFLCFGKRRSGHLLVSATADKLTVWDLLSCAVLWSVDLSVTLLTEDPKTDILAAFTADRNLFVFSPSEPRPIYCHQNVCPVEVIGATFVPQTGQQHNYGKKSKLSWQEDSQLYFIDKRQQLCTITLQQNLQKAHGIQEILHDNLPQTPFSQLMSAEKKSSGQKSTMDKDAPVGVYSRTDYIRELLSTAPHVQPSVTSLCATFIDALLLHKKQDSSNKEDDDDDSEQSGTETESDSDLDMEVTIETQDKTRMKRKNRTQESDSDLDMEVAIETQGKNQDEAESVEIDTTTVSSDVSDGPLVDKIVDSDFQWFADLKI